jgi:hypothetical protein
MIMLKKQAALQAFNKTVLVVLATAVILVACAPAQSADQIQSQVETSVAMTVQSQGQMGTAVAATLTAQAPQTTPTSSPTAVPLELPTLPPDLATVTPFVVVPPSGGGNSGNSTPRLSCNFTVRPFDNTAFKPGDPFDIRWIITNTGTDTWEGLDLNYFSGPHFTTAAGFELPEVKPGHTYTVKLDANAPLEKGHYVMTWKLQGGFCYPYVAITVGKPGKP